MNYMSDGEAIFLWNAAIIFCKIGRDERGIF